MSKYEKWELEHLVMTLSELLGEAIRTQGEMTKRGWERMEEAQRKAYVVRHPEVEEPRKGPDA